MQQKGRASRGASLLFSQGTRHMEIAKAPPYRPSQSPSVTALPEGEPGPQGPLPSAGGGVMHLI